jgi:hypothetical protein
MKKNISDMNRLLIFVFLLVASIASGQNSSVVLSSLKVTDIIDPSAREMNNFMIDVSASAPSSLSRLEVVFEENGAMILTTYIPVVINAGKAELKFDKYTIPFEGQNVRFIMKVRDQFRSPYHKILVKGYDLSNQETNQVTFSRPK